MHINFAIRPASPIPIFRQIVEQVKTAVIAGKVADDEALPSVRALAEHLVINPNTVARAYGELAREGVIESRQGKGMFVSLRREIYSREERIRRIEHSVSQLLTEAFVLGFSAAEIVNEIAKRARDLEPKSRSPKSGNNTRQRDSR